MKKLLAAAVAILCVTSIAVQAEDAPKKEKKKPTPEQIQIKNDMLAKYDTNKDGKLDKAEREAMSPADKETFHNAFPGMPKKKEHSEESK